MNQTNSTDDPSDHIHDLMKGFNSLGVDHQGVFDDVFSRLKEPISDYTFANIYIWGKSLRLWWDYIHNHLCLFANGIDLTLLIPPIGLPGATEAQMRKAITNCFEIMDDANNRDGWVGTSRIEYVSEEMLHRMAGSTEGTMGLGVKPMSGDYVYSREDMVNLEGARFKTRRKERAKFEKLYPDHRTETLNESHIAACDALLERWHQRGDETHEGQLSLDQENLETRELRHREVIACREALRHHKALNLRGMVLYVGDQLAGFTIGELLQTGHASILIEKTDASFDSTPQFIFSRFCRDHWDDCEKINAGDDWGIPTLRYTKESYRPIDRLWKYELSRPRPVRMIFWSIPSDKTAVLKQEGLKLVNATEAHSREIKAIEDICFGTEDAFNHRQIQRLLKNPRAITRLAILDDKPVGWCVGLTHRRKLRTSGRIYTLAVKPECTGKGIGAALLADMIHQLEYRGIGRIALEVAMNNQRAMKLYLEYGFTASTPLPNYYGPDKDGIRLVRENTKHIVEETLVYP